MGAGQFDLVFVDGAHTYHQVLQDLTNSARLLRDGGILCGDDLELQAAQVDMQFTLQNTQSDFIQDPKTGKWYHPGVTRALAGYFGHQEVSAWEGFWAMRVRGTGGDEVNWERVAIEMGNLDVVVPEHLRS